MGISPYNCAMPIIQRIKNAANILRRDGLRALIVAFISRNRLRLSIHNKFMWRSGVQYELRFWDDWFRTQGLQRPDKYQEKVNPEQPLQERLLPYLPAQAEVQILDVGAGPLTSLGKKTPGKTLHITAVDALADDYDRLLAKYAVVPPVRTHKLDAETLASRFPPASFDLVYASNAIDHVYDPEKAIVQMLAVLKPGGYMVLEHYENEAENENYSGFHQWNFCMSPQGDFWISSLTRKTNISQKYAPLCEVSCSRMENKMLFTVLHKR